MSKTKIKRGISKAKAKVQPRSAKTTQDESPKRLKTNICSQQRAVLRSCWDHFGTYLAILSDFGASLDNIWSHFNSLWALLGSFLGQLGAISGDLRTSLAILGASLRTTTFKIALADWDRAWAPPCLGRIGVHSGDEDLFFSVIIGLIFLCICLLLLGLLWVHFWGHVRPRSVPKVAKMGTKGPSRGSKA